MTEAPGDSEAAAPEAEGNGEDQPAAEEEPAPAPDEPITETAGEAPAIAADEHRSASPVRFVWRTDAEGKFSHISPEFANSVGAEAADIVGRSFEEVADALQLDPKGEIAGLLARRDTWSGRSVLWPVAGTDLHIPVDLAALPVYDRARAFEGFRGFGVARAGDASVDPKALGLTLGRTPEEPQGDDAAPAEPVDESKADPFQGEVPALSIVPAPDRRFTDKVIRLAEHRPPPANDKGLSSGERIAFQQIGERLKKDSRSSAKDKRGGTPADRARGFDARSRATRQRLKP